MTNSLNAAGALLTASVEDRTLTYRLLPYGEEGRTSLGRVTASQGSVTIPEDVSSVTLNMEHDYKRPVGRATQIEEADAGLTATFRIARTTAGDDLLAEAAEGLRPAVSVEIESPVIRAGRLVSGLLQAAGAVVRPAFAGALLMAEDHGELAEALDDASAAIERARALNDASDTEDETTPSESEETTQNTDNTELESSMSENAAVPAALHAAGNAASTPEVNAQSIARAYATRDSRLAASLSETGENLFAELAPIGHTANRDNVSQAQWIGRMWEGKTYTRKYVPLLSTGSLTSWKVEGWKFVTKPTVEDYAGDLAEVHSTAATTEPYSVNAARIAGGFRYDRAYADLGNTDFINGLYEAAVEDYARKSDAKAFLAIRDNATAVVGGETPAGVNAGMARVVDGVLEMIDFATPSFALVSADVYRSILLTRSDDSLQYLSSSLGFEDGSVGNFRLVPSSDLAAGTVIVGAKEALTFYELPGSPVRLSALDVSHYGQEEVLHGYYAVVVNDARGLVSVSAPVEA